MNHYNPTLRRALRSADLQKVRTHTFIGMLVVALAFLGTIATFLTLTS